MKQGTIEVVVKGLCFVLIGGLTNFGSNLSQWQNSGKWPDKITWVVIIGSCTLGAATQLLSFMSSTYTDYKALPPANGHTPLPPPPAPPTGPQTIPTIK